MVLCSGTHPDCLPFWQFLILSSFSSDILSHHLGFLPPSVYHNCAHFLLAILSHGWHFALGRILPPWHFFFWYKRYHTQFCYLALTQHIPQGDSSWALSWPGSPVVERCWHGAPARLTNKCIILWYHWPWWVCSWRRWLLLYWYPKTAAFHSRQQTVMADILRVRGGETQSSLLEQHFIHISNIHWV